MPAKKKDPTTEALEQEKLKLEIARLELDNRKLATDVQSFELAYKREQENWGVRFNAQRVYHFNDAIFGDAVAHCMMWIRDRISIDPNAPIEIIFNSPGGSVLDGLELYDHLLDLRAGGTRIDTTILGMAASMAGVVSQVGETRRIGPNAYFMVHEVASVTLGKLSTMKDAVKLSERLYDRCLGILASRSRMSVAEIRDMAERKDWWLSADEAMERGFVDVILSTPYSQVA